MHNMSVSSALCFDHISFKLDYCSIHCVFDWWHESRHALLCSNEKKKKNVEIVSFGKVCHKGDDGMKR